MNRSLILAICTGLSLMPTLAQGAWSDVWDSRDQCEVQLQSDITIRSDAIEIVSDAGDRMIIADDQALAVNGKTVELDAAERAALQAYAAQMRRTIPEIVALALDAVEIALTAISEVFYGLTDNGPPQHLLDTIDGIQEAVAASMSRDATTVRMHGGELSGLEEAMANLEPAIESAVADALGDMMVSIGEAMRSGDTNVAELVADIAVKSQRLEQDIEERVGPRAKALERRAQGLCDQIYALQAAESSLQSQVPAARAFDVVEGS